VHNTAADYSRLRGSELLRRSRHDSGHALACVWFCACRAPV